MKNFYYNERMAIIILQQTPKDGRNKSTWSLGRTAQEIADGPGQGKKASLALSESAQERRERALDIYLANGTITSVQTKLALASPNAKQYIVEGAKARVYGTRQRKTQGARKWTGTQFSANLSSIETGLTAPSKPSLEEVEDRPDNTAA